MSPRTRETPSASRPITFVFNGGPGRGLGLSAPSAWSARASPNSPATTRRRPRLQDNPQTWLAFTDLVMIDPVGTGWSRPAKADGGSAFYGVRSDAQSLAKAIALYLAKNGRGASPKYILGESYGGFRAAKVAQTLQREQGIALSGIVMVSPLIEGGLIFGGTRFALGAALQLPSLAAAELERKGTFSKEAQARGRALRADRLSHHARRPAAQGRRRARFLCARCADQRAARERRDQVARLHPRRLRQASALGRGQDRQPLRRDLRGRRSVSRSRRPRAAPIRCSMALSARYGSAFATHARDELGFKTEMTYILLASDISGKWDWDGGRGAASASDDLRELLSLDSVVPAAHRARLQRHGDALCGEPLRARPSAADRRPVAHAAPALSRRAHVLHRRRIRAKPSAPTPRRSINRRNDDGRARARRWAVGALRTRCAPPQLPRLPGFGTGLNGTPP